MPDGTTMPVLSPEAVARREELAGKAAALARVISEGGITAEIMKGGMPWEKLRLPRNWRLLYAAQGGLCSLCGEFMLPRSNVSRARGTISEEHVQPRSRGGGGRDARNVVLAHTACNTAKGRRLPTKEELQYAEAIWDRVEAAQAALDAEERAAEAQRRIERARQNAHYARWLLNRDGAWAGPREVTVAAAEFAGDFERYRERATGGELIKIENEGRIVGAYLSAEELDRYEWLKRREREALIAGERSGDLVGEAAPETQAAGWSEGCGPDAAGESEAAPPIESGAGCPGAQDARRLTSTAWVPRSPRFARARG